MLASPLATLAASGEPLTRAQVRADLVQYEMPDGTRTTD
ncbi:DUF4148 domain-containing protein (plasmid) [Paraburkholderia strydomiana]